jgi:hypothetical protein
MSAGTKSKSTCRKFDDERRRLLPEQTMAKLLKGISEKTQNLVGRMLGKNRRRFQRFVGRTITPVFIGPGAPEAAALIDISLGGLSLEYTAGTQPLKKIFSMDLQAQDGFRLGKVLFEKVSEREIRGGEGPYTHRLRAKFLNLSQAKANKLGKFLEIYQENLGDGN